MEVRLTQSHPVSASPEKCKSEPPDVNDTQAIDPTPNKALTTWWGRWQERRLARRVFRECRGDLQGIEAYTIFVGYPRSGHSLVGSLLDAHPEIILAHEADALAYVQAGFSRDELFARLLENSRAFTRSGREWTDYKYAVPGQHHGSYTRLRIIGDKKGQNTTFRFASDPGLLERTRRLVGVPLKFIHVVRNPYDNIATISRRENISLERAADIYFTLSRNVKELEAAVDADDWHSFRHESLIDDPPPVIRGMCSFLGVDCPEDYEKACAGIVFKSPNQSRHKADWDAGTRERIEQEIAMNRYLTGYRFDD